EESLKAWEDGAFLLARYGITPSTPSSGTFDKELGLAYYERFYKRILELGAPHLEIAPESWPVIVKNGWEDIAYYYYGSEWPGHENPKNADIIRMKLKKAPGVKVSVAGVKPNECLKGLVKVWVLLTREYGQSSLIYPNDEVWWYVCCSPGPPYANLQLDAGQIDPRVLGWQLFQYGCTGFYYWRASMIRNNMQGERPEEKWPNRPWNTATSDVPASHNDGQLIYPGPGGKAWSCIRLENMRDGADDYDYLCVLRDYVDQLKRLKGKRAGDAISKLIQRAEDALRITPELSVAVDNYTKDPAVVERERRRVCGLIEEVKAALSAIFNKALLKSQ
ncbi:MAG: DUF4091 domain-containing protein, partial [Candidatus Omnitrophica bacterium]|nr:DUF4091 domain-containing protein [Candidatus Omnitrophota bacterium]